MTFFPKGKGGNGFFISPYMTRRLLLTLALILLAILLSPRVVHAEPPFRPPERSAAARIPPPEVCDDREELASVIQAEAFNQPYEAQVAIAQIVKMEADKRGLSVCALTRLTNFVAVRLYAQSHPGSWTARQMDNPLEWSLIIADDVLRNELPDMRQGAMHFDGVDRPGVPIIWQAGQTRFFR